MSGISHDKLLPVLAQTDVPLESSIAVLSSSESRAHFFIIIPITIESHPVFGELSQWDLGISLSQCIWVTPVAFRYFMAVAEKRSTALERLR